MKYISLTILVLLMPASALAASISFAPAVRSVGVGESFTLIVMVQPASSTLESVRADIAYDPALLEEAWFAFAPAWLVISEPGYDSVDNSTGSVIKTAGYPGGITRPTELGVITFRAKSAGRAEVIAAGDTQLLDAESENQFSGNTNVAVITIGDGAAAATAPGAWNPPTLPAAAPARVAPAAPATLAASAGLAPVSLPRLPILIALACFLLSALGSYAFARWQARRAGDNVLHSP